MSHEGRKRFAAAHSDPVGTSLHLTDCDRMTFRVLHHREC